MSTATAKRNENLTEGPLFRKIILFVLPLIATSILQLLFNTADTIVVGRWGGDTVEECENALAAVGSCGALINLIVNLFMGLSTGASVAVAHAIGAGRDWEVDDVVHTSILLALLTGIVTGVFGFCMAGPLLTMMGTEPEVLDQAIPYMRAYFVGMTANMIYNYCAAILRAIGDTTRPLVFLSAGGVLNVILNLVMVLVFRLGALGVGIATAASQLVSCVLILIFMMRKQGICHFNPRRLRFEPKALKKILLIGLPSGLQGTVFSLSNVLIQSSVNSLGKVVVAGNSAGSNLDGYIYMIQNAFYHATLTFLGQHVGARKYKRAKQVVLECCACVVAAGLIAASVVIFFGRSLLALYAPGNDKAIENGMLRLIYVGGPYFFCGLMEVGSACMRGLGKSFTSMMTSLIGSCALRIVWIYTIFVSFHTLEVLYISYPVSWAVTAAAHFTLFFFAFRKFRKNDKTLDLRAAAPAKETAVK